MIVPGIRSRSVPRSAGDHDEVRCCLPACCPCWELQPLSRTAILESVGCEVDNERMELLLSQLSGKDITELIAAGREKFASVPCGGGGGGGVAVAAAAPAAGGAAPAAEAKKRRWKRRKKVMM